MAAYVHSHSSLKTFRTCPYKFLNDYFTKEFTRPWVQSDAAAWGDRVHKAIENAWLFQEKELQPGFEKEAWLLTRRHQFKTWLEGLQPDGEFGSTAEWQVGIKRDGGPCTFFQDDVYFRGKLDFLATCGDAAIIQDTKTGNPKYPDINQLETQAVLLFASRPEINRVIGFLDWTQRPNVPDTIRIYRDAKHVGASVDRPVFYRDIEQSLLFELNRIDRLIAQDDKKVWPKTSNGLCRQYCEIPKDICKHSGRIREVTHASS